MRRVAKQLRTEVNGAVSTFTYDAKDRLTQDATSAPLAHTYTYTYDSRDNILTNSESGGVVQMNYDGASRLTTSTSGGVTTTYTFDSNGNLTGVNAAGTLTTMVYDKENRLKEHKQGAAANTRTFTYDLNSLKQSETFSNATNQLVWDSADMLGEVPAAKPVGAPLMPTRYNLAQGILFATTRFEPDPVRTDTGADFIGSILIDFDENGDYVAERRYKPYGELLAGTATTYGWTGNSGSRFTVIQFAEQYNRRRHYSTKLKQWTTRDPLWPDESAYGYVSGRPMTWNDPSGLICQSGADCCQDFERNNRHRCQNGHWQPCNESTWKSVQSDCFKNKLGESGRKSFCSELKEIVLDALSMCGKMCGQSGNTGGVYSASEKWDALFACCENNPCTPMCCSSSINKFRRSQATSCNLVCLVSHEQYHSEQCRTGQPISECCAYKHQAACLIALLISSCGRDSVKGSISSQILRCGSASAKYNCKIGLPL